MITIRGFATRFLVTLAAAGALAAQAQYPNKPIKWVVPYTPGGITDSVTRMVTAKISESLGQPIVIGVGDPLRDQLRVVKELPEAVREAGEMMTRERRSHAGVDADKQRAHTRADAVAQWR